MKYNSYFTSPFRVEQTLSMEEKVDIIKKNILAYNVTIGIVERMSESMEILQYLLDGDEEATPTFREFGLKENDEGAQKGHKGNRSPVSASVLLEHFRKDEEFYRKLLEHVKYEQQITDFALDIHMRQHELIRERKRSRMQ